MTAEMDSRGPPSISGKEHQHSELRLVLLGGRCAGKSSVGNAILGKEEFACGIRTGTCVRGEGEAGGRRVTVVDTPGWWCDFTAGESPRLLKEEIWRGVTLCAPGPHAFLLLVKMRSHFTEKRRRAVEEHLELFGRTVWKHTLVLFICGDRLGDRAPIQHIQRQSKALRCLVEKCGNRCLVFDSKAPNAELHSQVTELLDKVLQMVRENGRLHYKMDARDFKQAEARRKEVNGRVKQRLAEVQKFRSLLIGAVQPLPEVRILLLGPRRSGKSSAGNRILGQSQFRVCVRTASCAIGRGGPSGRRVVVIDTPGWWMNYFAEDSTEYDRREVRRSVGLCPPGPHAVLAAVRADRCFSETHRRALAEHMELLGGGVWKHALVLFTFADCLGGSSIEEHIEMEGGALQWLVEKCGRRYLTLSAGNDSDSQVTRLLERIEETAAQNGGQYYEPNDVLQEEAEWRQEVESAKERMKKVREQRRAIRSLFPGGIPSLSELTVVLLGQASSGKSSAGNTILGREEFQAGRKTDRWREGLGQACGRAVTVVDTPGWRTGRSEAADVGERENSAIPPLRTGRPTALLLVVNASCSFSEEQRRAAERRVELLGEEARSHALVLFTHGDWLGDVSVEWRIESEGGALRWLVEKCGNRYHVLDNSSEREASQVRDLLEKIEEMEAGRRSAKRERRRDEEMTAQLPVQHPEEELEKFPLLTSACSDSGLYYSGSKRSIAVQTLEKQEPLKLDQLPLLGSSPQGRTTAGGSDTDAFYTLYRHHIPGREKLGSSELGPHWLSGRAPNGRPDAGDCLVKADIVAPPSGPTPRGLFLLLPVDQLKTSGWNFPESVSGKAGVEVSTRGEGSEDGTAEGLVQSGGRAARLQGERRGRKGTIEQLESFIDACVESVRDKAEEDLAKPVQGSLPLPPSLPSVMDRGAVNELDHCSLSSTDQKPSSQHLKVLRAIQTHLLEMDQTVQRSHQIIRELRENAKEAETSITEKSVYGGEPRESAFSTSRSGN